MIRSQKIGVIDRRWNCSLCKWRKRYFKRWIPLICSVSAKRSEWASIYSTNHAQWEQRGCLQSKLWSFLISPLRLHFISINHADWSARVLEVGTFLSLSAQREKKIKVCNCEIFSIFHIFLFFVVFDYGFGQAKGAQKTFWGVAFHSRLSHISLWLLIFNFRFFFFFCMLCIREGLARHHTQHTKALTSMSVGKHNERKPRHTSWCPWLIFICLRGRDREARLFRWSTSSPFSRWYLLFTIFTTCD